MNITPLSPLAANSAKMRPVAECVSNLTVLFQCAREILRYEGAWLAGVPYWDAKRKLGEHILEDAQNAETLLERLHELKAVSAEHKQVAGVETFVREFACAGNGDEWLAGLYRVLKPWLAGELVLYLATSDPLMDAPSHQAIGRMLTELKVQIEWFEKFSPAYSSWEHPEIGPWLAYARALAAQTKIVGENLQTATSSVPARPEGHPDFTGITEARRDRTFNVVSSRKDAPKEDDSFESRRFMVFYNHLQEMQFAESLGALLYETSEMPWAYHHDLARHISDEVRHANMGKARLEELGHKMEAQPMMTQHYAFRTTIDPLERFCLMTLVMEGSSFDRKRQHVALFEAQGDADSARYESYDIRDEMMHTNLGHLWVPIMLRVYHDSRSLMELTEHCRSLISQVITEYPANEATMVKR